jgi:c-di-GMP-binding flagellar brake protein YcgR
MSTVMVLEPARRDRALDEATSRNVGVVLSMRGGEEWSVFKSRFLGADDSHNHLVVEYPPAPVGTRRPDVQLGENIGVAFRRGHKKCVFTAVVMARGEYALNGQTRVESLTLSWPDSVQELQRRAYYRVPVPRTRNVSVLVFRGGTSQRKKARSAHWPKCTARLSDLSAGGMRVVLPPGKKLPLNCGDAVGLEFQPEVSGPMFLIDAVLRHVAPTADESLALGLQFVGLEASVDGRKTLQQLLRVVSQYQRAELRYTKLASESDGPGDSDASW